MAEDEFHNLRADIATAVERVEADLAERGCEAGDYRLTGNRVDYICVIHLRDRRGKELAPMPNSTSSSSYGEQPVRAMLLVGAPSL